MREPPPCLVPRRRWLRTLSVGAGLALLAACGGGGAPLEAPKPPEKPPDGITGRITAPDLMLGRLAEREPNGGAGLAFRLPPVAARTRLEVAGTLAATAAYTGAADVLDVLRYTTLAAADLSLSVGFPAADALSAAANEVTLEVFDAEGRLLARDSGAPPLSAALPLAALQSIRVHLRVDAGHLPWVAAFATQDPVSAPKPGPVEPAPLGLRAADVDAAPCADSHLLVRLKPGVDAAAWAQARGLVAERETGGGSWRMRYPCAPGEDGAAKAKRSAGEAALDPDVVFAEPDWLVQPLGDTNDADLGRQWNLRAVGAQDAWEITRGSASIVIGVVDSGVVAHPDLQGQTVPGYDFITDATRAGDGDGPDANPTDVGDQGHASGLSTWHGTHVSAIAVGRADDGVGVAGVAPGCRVMPLRALGVGGGLSSDVADAILYAAGLYSPPTGERLSTPLRIVNLSLGTNVLSAEMQSACAAAADQGVLLVAASGNVGGAVGYPAAFPSVLAVTAVDGLLQGTTYSSYGPEVSLCAPGGVRSLDQQGDGWPDAILSAVVDETQFPRALGHAWYVGTSQAAPHVAAAAALLLSLAPALTPSQVRQRLEQAALDRGLPGRDVLHGWGLLQVGTALKYLKAEMGQPLLVPRLALPVPTLRFAGLESLHSVPILNAGGGVLDVAGTQISTDDGALWLGATLVPGFVGADSTAARLDVIVDRASLPTTPGWYSGTVRIYGSTGMLGAVRVTASVNTWSRAGSVFRVVALDQATGGVHSDGWAHPQDDYRYWLRGLPPGTYVIKAGDDLDADGFFCEPGDVCGWFGGPTEADALPLTLIPGTAFTATDVTLR